MMVMNDEPPYSFKLRPAALVSIFYRVNLLIKVYEKCSCQPPYVAI